MRYGIPDFKLEKWIIDRRLSQLAAVFEDRKGIELFFEEARLDQEKEDPERLRMFRK